MANATSTQKNFSTLPSVSIGRSQFDRSHNIRTTFDAGYLVPILADEVLPGDTFRCNMQTFARLATPIAPIMDELFVETHFFAVPMRILWANFKKMMGERLNPDDSTDYVIPTLVEEAITEGGLYDYFGVPPGTESPDISAMYGRAYNAIYNEWFRSQDLQDRKVVNALDGPDNQGWFPLMKRGKRHDYFTSCLPWAQKSDPVTLPMSGNAPVVAVGDGIPSFDANDSIDAQITSDSANAGILGLNNVPASSANLIWNTTALEADLSEVNSATINQLRQSAAIQRLFEKDARGGTRYTEMLRSHFGVVSPDARMQRPEYLGGGSTKVEINQVPQTTSTDGTSPQGNLAAYGVANGSGGSWTYSATEHCILIGLVSVRSPLNYQQGIPKQFTRSTRFDFYMPELAHLGEQAVLNKELFVSNDANDDAVFGYNERWSEYRYKPSLITGKMRSSATGSLDLWHLAQDFPSLPVLDATFIEEDPPIARVVATPNEPDFIMDGWLDYKVTRPMPVFSTPGMTGRF